MRHLDLFSGIGGFALAASWIWGNEHELVSFCDNDKAAQIVLSKHWPGVPIHDDIKTLDATKWRGTVDLVTGGFPCQPFSCAGKRRGAADDRYLWPEMLRVIAECQPRWVLGENVPGIIGMEFDRLLADLEGEGYEVWPLVIPACAVDAPHIRARVWIVANNSLASNRQHEAEQKGRDNSERSRQDVADAARAGLEGAITTGAIRAERLSAECGAVADASIESPREQTDESDTFSTCGRTRDESGNRRLDVPDAKPKGHETWMQSETISERGCSRWPTEPAICRVVNGVPYRVDRLRLLGNAIVPQVAEQIFRAMKVVDGA